MFCVSEEECIHQNSLSKCSQCQKQRLLFLQHKMKNVILSKNILLPYHPVSVLLKLKYVHSIFKVHRTSILSLCLQIISNSLKLVSWSVNCFSSTPSVLSYASHSQLQPYRRDSSLFSPRRFQVADRFDDIDFELRSKLNPVPVLQIHIGSRFSRMPVSPRYQSLV